MREALRDMIMENGFFVPNPKIILPMLQRDRDKNVGVVLFSKGKIIEILFGKNIVTNAGDTYYAQKACGESPGHAFADMYLASAGPATPIKTDTRNEFTDIAGTNKAKTATYPKTADGDADNTGAGVDVVSWLFSYLTSDGNWTGITHAYITINTPDVDDDLLCSIIFGASWVKDANTSAKVFVNHTANGV